MAMAQCDVCGNHYEKTMEIRLRRRAPDSRLIH
jgi:hypothetical protein